MFEEKNTENDCTDLKKKFVPFMGCHSKRSIFKNKKRTQLLTAIQGIDAGVLFIQLSSNLSFSHELSHKQ